MGSLSSSVGSGSGSNSVDVEDAGVNEARGGEEGARGGEEGNTPKRRKLSASTPRYGGIGRFKGLPPGGHEDGDWISTGDSGWDGLMGGGVRLGSLVEVTGERWV